MIGCFPFHSVSVVCHLLMFYNNTKSFLKTSKHSISLAKIPIYDQIDWFSPLKYQNILRQSFQRKPISPGLTWVSLEPIARLCLFKKSIWHLRLNHSLVLEWQRAHTDNLRPSLRGPTRTHTVAFWGLADGANPFVNHSLSPVRGPVGEPLPRSHQPLSPKALAQC